MKTRPEVWQAAKKPPRKSAVWSIGIFSGPTLSELRPVTGVDMPVLSAQDVADVPAEFVADPFMIVVKKTWYMFFEVMNARTGKGDIGLAISQDGLKWDYQQIVLSEPFHLSYPYIFCHRGEHFMIPESYEASSVRLYRADPFPLKWAYAGTLLEGPWVDSSLFFFDGRWWMFSNPVSPENQVLELFHADMITGPWQRHPMSPLITGNKRIARGGGRNIVLSGRPIRFAQDCVPVYGTGVRAFEVSVLTASDYAEQELPRSPILTAGDETWRAQGMHHIDAHFLNSSWFACVDGWRLEERTLEAPTQEFTAGLANDQNRDAQ